MLALLDRFLRGRDGVHRRRYSDGCDTEQHAEEEEAHDAPSLAHARRPDHDQRRTPLNAKSRGVAVGSLLMMTREPSTPATTPLCVIWPMSVRRSGP